VTAPRGPEIHLVGDVPPWLVSEADQAVAAVADMRADKPAAREELRCVAPPLGCGRPLGAPLDTAFRDRASRAEYAITGTCQRCQDELFKPDEDEVAAMAADTKNFGRCWVCGEYREMERVDVGVGVISGFNCCYLSVTDPNSVPTCERTEGCFLGADHAHRCEGKAGLL
jgi:hypothetical protein